MAGRWINARGSVVELGPADPDTGRFHGQFVSESSLENSYALVGWANSTSKTQQYPDAVISLSFTVRWGETGSITAWTGHCRTRDKTMEIHTQWHLVRSVSENDFDHIHAGSDVFHPMPPSK